MAKPLTAVAINKLRSGAARREIPDGACAGLHLVIQPSGSKSWALRYRRPDKRPAKLVLGKVDGSAKVELDKPPVIGSVLTLAAARRLVGELQHEIALGRDPAALHFAARELARTSLSSRLQNTFDKSAQEFIRQHASKKVRRWHEQARLLGLNPADVSLRPNGLAARWSKRSISDIDAQDIHSIVDETRHSGAPGLERRSKTATEARARAMFSVLSKMFAWLVQCRRIARNPCSGVHRPDTPKARDRILSEAEIAKFWLAADQEAPVFSSSLKLLLLTGCRLNEVAGMHLPEINFDKSIWVIPGSRTKNGRVHIVPLSDGARSILLSAVEDCVSSGLVFSTTKKTPVSGWSKVKARIDSRMNIPPWRLHDLRRTTATGMAELGVQPHIVEAALNHVSGARAGVAGVYNRALYTMEKTAAMNRWDAHVKAIVQGTANVLPLRRSS